MHKMVLVVDESFKGFGFKKSANSYVELINIIGAAQGKPQLEQTISPVAVQVPVLPSLIRFCWAVALSSVIELT